jgi:hypothetical protein
MSYSTRRAGRRSDIPQSVVSFYANSAYFEIADQLPDELREQIAVSSTTSGENRIQLPNDFDSPINVSILSNAVDNSSDHTLIQVGPSYVDNEGFFPVGEPRYYVLFADYMELYPSPNSAYSVQMRYRSHITDLVSTDDVPSIHTSARKAIMYLTEAEVWADIDDDTRERTARQRAFNTLSTAKNVYARRNRAIDKWGVRPVYPEVRQVSKRSFDVV